MDSFSHSFGESTYHLWWITKYRYKTLSKRGHKYLCRDVLMQVAGRHGISVRSLAVGDDHVHLVATIPPTMSVSKALQLLKGASAHTLFEAIPNLRLRYPRGHFWGMGGKFRSVGEVDVHTVISYVDHQNQTNLREFN
jgi:putative transposase